MMEAEVAVCTRAEYQSHQHASEAAPASGAMEQALDGVRPRHRLLLRQLTADDLGRLHNRKPSIGSSPPPSLRLGLHLIVPFDWGLQPSSYTTIDYRNVIFLGES
ncbi:Dedicator of cytokinesis protein 9 [Echinococcus multilocularis]|uniref:Dedicator of cytokinesis protein 9 n=1 Tax=Echinococcus multilocularis TaxID=6211 RepID=A0A0S4MMK0_ECHMU|nr:Dedicator of cytokinesis protein 9 [Echinococcus multilocularis]